MSFSTIPANASLEVEPFRAEAREDDVQELRQLVKLSRLGPQTYENTHTDSKDFTGYGISYEWMSAAKRRWETEYDWHRIESRINGFPNFTADIKQRDETINVHFMALFSQRSDAIPFVMMHGWPGSILEFLDVLDLLRSKYTPATLPYHVVVPSLPGYAYSSGPPVDQEFTTEDTAEVIDKLMIGLGFGDGYIAQGGDIGSFVAKILGATSETCKAIHVNMCIALGDFEDSTLTEVERKQLQRAKDFYDHGRGYSMEHGTRPATIGFVLASNPVALLAWHAEKFLQVSDEDPSLDTILDSVTLYWLTSTFPRAIYPYRQLIGSSKAKATNFHSDPRYYVSKPMGYSLYPKECVPIPKAWAAKTGNLVWCRYHDEGGHFAAMEKPELFLKDLEDFVGEVWPVTKT